MNLGFRCQGSDFQDSGYGVGGIGLGIEVAC